MKRAGGSVGLWNCCFSPGRVSCVLAWKQNQTPGVCLEAQKKMYNSEWWIPNHPSHQSKKSMLGPEGYTALLSESFRHFLIFIKSIMDSYWEKKKNSKWCFAPKHTNVFLITVCNVFFLTAVRSCDKKRYLWWLEKALTSQAMDRKQQGRDLWLQNDPPPTEAE